MHSPFEVDIIVYFVLILLQSSTMLVVAILGIYLRWLGASRIQDRDLLVDLKARMDILVTHGDEINKLRHKQQQLDLNMATMKERQTGLEAALSSLQSVISSITGHFNKKKDL